MMMDISSLLLRDFSDLTRPELIARAKHLDILRVRVAYTHDNFSPRQLAREVCTPLMAGYRMNSARCRPLCFSVNEWHSSCTVRA
ncbi:hypothetical protein GAR96_22015 [Salmonella enterica]|nr:hypothetical protein [Salmonella enterica]